MILSSQDRFLAIIPARAGSKGIPFKNMRTLGGIPLVGHSIRAALGATTVGRVIVSTDSPDIADYATQIGVRTARLRPAHLSDDHASSADVVKYEIDTHAAETGERFEHVILLQPTSPLRTEDHIDAAVTRYRLSGAASLISVCEVGAGHPDYMYREREGVLVKYLDSVVGAPRQNLERVYLRNGAIYITGARYLQDTGRLASPQPAFYVMDRRSSINIDDPEDLLLAEALLRT